MKNRLKTKEQKITKTEKEKDCQKEDKNKRETKEL